MSSLEKVSFKSTFINGGYSTQHSIGQVLTTKGIHEWGGVELEEHRTTYGPKPYNYGWILSPSNEWRSGGGPRDRGPLDTRPPDRALDPPIGPQVIQGPCQRGQGPRQTRTNTRQSSAPTHLSALTRRSFGRAAQHQSRGGS